MKIVVQNGSNTGFSRAAAEATLRTLPATLIRVADQLGIFRSSGAEFHVTFHRKGRVLCLHWPSMEHPQPNHVDVVRELVISLAAVAAFGHLPERLNEAAKEGLSQKYSRT